MGKRSVKKNHKTRFDCRFFTLLEILSAVAIIGIFTVISVAYLMPERDSSSHSGLIKKADELAVFLQRARLAAIRDGEIQKVVWNSDESCWLIPEDGKKMDFPDFIDVRIINPDQEEILRAKKNDRFFTEDPNGEETLYFYPSGDMTGRWILLKNREGYMVRLRCSTMTGEIYKDVGESGEDLQRIKEIVPIQEKEL